MNNHSGVWSNMANLTKAVQVNEKNKGFGHLLSVSQLGVLYHCAVDATNSAYVVKFAAHLKGHLNVRLLQHATEMVWARHPILRSRLEPYAEMSEHPMLLYTNYAETDLTPNIFTLLQGDESDSVENFYSISPYADSLAKVSLTSINCSEWIFRIAAHHLIVDGTSLQVILREIAIIYNGLLIGGVGSLPATTVNSLHDYVQLELVALSESRFEPKLVYWSEVLDGVDPYLEFRVPTPVTDSSPALSSRPPAIAQSVRIRISTENCAALRKFCVEAKTTLHSALLSVFQLVLSRYVSQEKFVVSCFADSRPKEDHKEVVGHFVNVLPIKYDPKPNLSFLSFVNNTTLQVLRGFENQVPFPLMAERVLAKRHVDSPPFFGATFTYQEADIALLGLSQVEVSSIDTTISVSKSPISLTCIANDKTIDLIFGFQVGVFDCDLIKTMGSAFVELLQLFLAEPTLAIDDTEIASTSDIEMVLRWNENTLLRTTIDALSVLDGFRQAARSWPESIAVSDGESRLTYAQLDEYSEHIASALMAEGASDNSVVAILLERSVDWVASLMGTVKAGCTYLPVDVTYPLERIGHILSKAKVQFIVTRIAFSEAFGDLEQKCIELERLDRKRINTKLERPSVLAHDIYIIFTSGSTGKPKGARVSHIGFLNLVKWYIYEVGLDRTSKVLIVTSPSFDLTQKNIFAPLMVGAEIQLLSNSRFDPELAKSQICESGTTLLNCTPSMLFMIFQDEEETLTENSLQVVVVGGEPVPVRKIALLRKLWKRPPRILNTYGPTECADVATRFWITDDTQHPIPIGRSLPNVSVDVVDNHLRILPIGVIGEICISGVGVGGGYVNDSTLTESAFVSNPYGEGLLYRTGDFGYFKSSGDIVLLGRHDRQIKIGGVRVELSEIESAISELSEVKSSAVGIKVHPNSGKTHVVAYVSMKEGTTIEPGALRKRLTVQLPSVMIPSYIIFVDEIPLSPNGKADWTSLPSPPWAEGDLGLSQNMSSLLELLAALFSEVVGYTVTDYNADFFELGGNSLSSLELLSKIRRSGITLTLSDFYSHFSVVRLALFLSEATQTHKQIGNYANHSRTASPYSADLVPRTYPLSPNQRWVLSLDGVNSTTFLTSFVLGSRDKVDTWRLRQSISQLVRRHSTLSSKFFLDGSSVYFESENDPESFHSVVSDFSHAESPNSSLQEFLTKIADRLEAEISLDTGNLLRVGVVRGINLGGREFIDHLVVVVHHFVFDDVSRQIFIDELNQFYSAGAEHLPVSLQKRTVSMAVWNEAINSYLRSNAFTQELEHWQGVARANTFTLVPDAPEGSQDNTQHFKETIQYSETLDAVLRANFPTFISSTLAETVLEYLSSDAILMGISNHGRKMALSDFDISDSIGWFSNTIPLLYKNEGTSWIRSLRDKRLDSLEQKLAAVPVSGLGYLNAFYYHHEPEVRSLFLTIRNRMMIGVNISQSNDFETMPHVQPFTLVRLFSRSPILPDIKPIRFLCHLDARGRNIEVKVFYNLKYFRRETVQGIFTSFVGALLRSQKLLDRKRGGE